MKNKDRICKMIKKIADKFNNNYSPGGFYKPKKNNVVKWGIIGALFILGVSVELSIVNVDTTFIMY